MKIFINNIPVYIKSEENIDSKYAYGLIVREFEKIIPNVLIEDVLIMNASFEQIDSLLKMMTDEKLKKVNSITISSRKQKELVHYLKDKFDVIKAAGGIVTKGNKLLLIYRKKIWDLPKGKKEQGEKIRHCAKREVEEETGVKVKVKYKITSVWHTYTHHHNKKRYILKKTYWFAMKCLDDTRMKPQKKEGISNVKWMNMNEVRVALKKSYRSIRYVMQEYIKTIKDPNQIK